MNINTAIDQLIDFAQNNLMLDELDVNYARNKILSIINVDEYRKSKTDDGAEDTDSCDALLTELLDSCVLGKLITASAKEKTAQRMMRALSLKPSELTDIYANTKRINAAKAEKWLDGYIRMAAYDKKVKGDAFAPKRTVDGVEFVATDVAAEEKYNGVYVAINSLIEYALNNLLLDDLDRGYAIQEVLNILSVKSYAETDIDVAITEYERPDAVIEVLKTAILEAKLAGADEIDNIIDMIMGAVSLKPSEINTMFTDLCSANSKKASDWLYEYCIKNNYIKRTLLDTNVRFKAGYTKGGLEITINKAKPEFADAKKAASGNAIKSGYPKCTICAENEGFAPLAKSTLRTVDIELGGGQWFWQYSPYGYFYKHGIAVNTEHTPMVVNSDAVIKLMDFVDRFPNLFIGCNAAMTGVGGSVLAHDHFQGGEETLPMHKAKVAINLTYPKFPLAEVGVLDWYNSVIRVTSQSRQVMKDLCDEIITGWEKYTDKKDIVAKDADGQHNGVSPTVRKLDNGRYCVDITLRNNRCTGEYPLGIFHAHPEYHAIKRESIGLIESQGLFILPGRLETQIAALNECLVEKTKLPEDMSDFKYIYSEIIKENGKDYTKVEASIAIKAELGSVCEKILENTAVFKTKEETAGFLVSLGSFKVK